MVLYELFCVTRADISRNTLKGIIRKTCTDILERGGVVRSIDYMGIEKLAYPVKAKDGEVMDYGRYWVVHFNGNCGANENVLAPLLKEQRTLRAQLFRRASTLPGEVKAQIQDGQ